MRPMARTATPAEPERLLVVLPNWVGDVVMATPILAALRSRYAKGEIVFLGRRCLREITAGGGWNDGETYWLEAGGWQAAGALRAVAQDLRARRFDLALLLTNSFRSALVAWLAGIPRRVGYARDGRSLLLTERLRPLRRHGAYVPAPLIDAYAALAERVGAPVSDRRLRLAVTPEQEEAGARLRRHYRLEGPYAIINPGAAFGAAKCWLPERFAQVCERLLGELGLRSAIVGAAHEAPLMRRIRELAKVDVACCDAPGTTLGSLKPLVRDAALLVCNDTGPRHYGNAFGTPTVTVFGPTHQEWTATGYAGEIALQAPVPCGPCQLKRCPLDHRCMTAVTADAVVEAARGLLRGARHMERPEKEEAAS